jgi:predicted lipoprotein with Yx(FWY)xxD motif
MEKRVVVTLLLAALVGCASSPTGKLSNALPTLTEGGILVDAKRITLYTYDSDKPGTGKSACYGVCAINWPPFPVASGATPSGDYTIVKRDDGTAQWAYKGSPLYYWPEDQEPGDRYGDNYENVWHVVKP